MSDASEAHDASDSNGAMSVAPPQPGRRFKTKVAERKMAQPKKRAAKSPPAPPKEKTRKVAASKSSKLSNASTQAYPKDPPPTPAASSSDQMPLTTLELGIPSDHVDTATLDADKVQCTDCGIFKDPKWHG